jgi:hypothetical protein
MLYSPALADPFESLNAHFHTARIVDAAPSVRLNGANRALIDLQSQLQAGQAKTVKKVVEPPDGSGASLVYAGYPYDPYA